MLNFWWFLAELVILMFLFLSQPPQLWFWLALFLLILFYNIEQALH